MKRPDTMSVSRVPLLGIALLAIGLRAVLVPIPLVHHADEIWQYLEPAYGMLTGNWVTTWEFHAGIRTWIIPEFLALPMGLGHALAPHTGLHLIMVRTVLALGSLSVVWVFYRLGRSIGRTHAVIAAFVGAVWFELVYFSSRALSDAIVVSLAFPAILLLYGMRARSSPRFAFCAGMLLALCFAVRFQIAPALLLLAVWGCGTRFRSAWLPLIAGGVVGLGLDIVADLHAGQMPLRWIIRNFQINLLQGRSATFGTAPWYWYITQICRIWGFGAFLIVPLALVGARRLPALLLAAILIIGLHSAIPHKEYRFVLLGVDLLVLLAAIGSADFISWAAARQYAVSRRALTGAASGLWLLMSVAGAAGGPFRDYWGNGMSASRALRSASQAPGLCGLAIYKPKSSPSAAYVTLNRPVPIYLFLGATAERDIMRAAPAFNVVETPLRFGPELDARYHLLSCSQKPDPRRPISFCVYVRPGACSASSPHFLYNRVLTAAGK